MFEYTTSYRSIYHSVDAKLVPPLASRSTFFTRSSTGFPLSLAIVRLHSTNPDLLNTDTWSSIPEVTSLTDSSTRCVICAAGFNELRSYTRPLFVSTGLPPPPFPRPTNASLFPCLFDTTSVTRHGLQASRRSSQDNNTRCVPSRL